jgi:hypothetical protein
MRRFLRLSLGLALLAGTVSLTGCETECFAPYPGLICAVPKN